MPSSRFCPRCEQPIPEHTLGGTCPSCGSALQTGGETPKAQETPANRDGDFALGADPNLTATHLTATLRQEPPVKKSAFAVPTIPNHTDVELLGQGGMGVVFRAVQRPTNRDVAVKVMIQFAADTPAHDRFLNEIRAQAKLKHAGIVPIYEAGDCSLGPYFTMELVRGKTLSQRMREGPVEPKEAARIIADVAEAVHAAHQEGIIHRDLKPSNILIDRDGRVKVTDFGLAKHVGGDALTEKGIVVGTPSYMSPEQAEADPEKVTKLADVYGLGSTLFHLATGHAPHQRATPAATLREKAADPTPLPRKYAPQLCPILEAIILRSMALAPGERFATAAALASDLRKWANDEPTDTKPPTHGQRVRRYLRRRRVAAAVVLALPVLAAAAVIVRDEMDPKKQIEAALKRGEKVTLVGETGLPRWHDWRFDRSEVQASTIGDGSAGFQTQGLSFLVLVDDPQADQYTLSLQIRHARRGTLVAPRVGVFLGLQDVPTQFGAPAFRWLACGYSDFSQPSPDPAADKRRAARHCLSIDDRWRFQRADGDGWYDTVGQINWCLFPPADRPDVENVWRTIVLSVSPDGVRVVWENAARPTGDRTVTAREIDKALIEEPVRTVPPDGAEAYPKPWNPRKPLGVYAYDSAIAFRNVVLQRTDVP